MAVKETTDAFLFLQVAENDRVILKYYTEECGEPCASFITIYQMISENERYKRVTFLTINADDNPAAKKRILDKRQPVITIYCDGKLLDSRHISSREGVEELLESLLKHKSNK
jgi:hypothetical protein